MPDGGTKEDFPHLSYTADAAIKAGTIRPIVIVGIENTQRRRDLTGPTEIAADKKIAPVVGGSDKFRAFIRDELIPRVTKEIRGNGTTGIIGESLAGLFIVETFLLEPTLFDIYIAIDPTLRWNNQKLTHDAAGWLDKGSYAGRTLYLSSGGTGLNDGNSKFASALAAVLSEHAPKQLRWRYRPHPDLNHSTIYRATKLDILKRVFPAKSKR